METRQEAEGLHEGVHTLNQQGVRDSMTFAEKSKTAGNKAFAQKERKAAVDAYTDAVDHLVDVLSQKPDDADEEKAKKLMAISYANRAAAYLLPGDGMDLDRALVDGKAAEKMDPTYSKAYACLLSDFSSEDT